MEDEEKKKWSRWIRSKLRPRFAYLYRALSELRWKDTDRSGELPVFLLLWRLSPQYWLDYSHSRVTLALDLIHTSTVSINISMESP